MVILLLLATQADLSASGCQLIGFILIQEADDVNASAKKQTEDVSPVIPAPFDAFRYLRNESLRQRVPDVVDFVAVVDATPPYVEHGPMAYREGAIKDQCHVCDELATASCGACEKAICRGHRGNIDEALDRAGAAVKSQHAETRACEGCAGRLEAIIEALRVSTPWWRSALGFLVLLGAMVAMMVKWHAHFDGDYFPVVIFLTSLASGGCVVLLFTGYHFIDRRRRRRAIDGFLRGAYSEEDLPDPVWSDFDPWLRRLIRRSLGGRISEERAGTVAGVLKVLGGVLGIGAVMGFFFLRGIWADEEQKQEGPGKLATMTISAGPAGKHYLLVTGEVELEARMIYRDHTVSVRRVDVIAADTGARVVRKIYPTAHSFETVPRPRYAGAGGHVWALYHSGSRGRVQLLNVPSLTVKRSWDAIAAAHPLLVKEGIRSWAAVSPRTGVIRLTTNVSDQKEVFLHPLDVTRELSHAEKGRFPGDIEDVNVKRRFGTLVADISSGVIHLPGGRVAQVVGAEDRTIQVRAAKERDARQLWSFDAGGKVRYAAAAKDRLVISVTSRRDHLIGLVLNSGVERWRRDL